MHLTEGQIELMRLSDEDRFKEALEKSNNYINGHYKEWLEPIKSSTKKIREKFSISVLDQLFDILKFIPKKDGSFHIILPGTNKHITIINDGKGALHVTDEEAKARGDKNCHHRFYFTDLISDLIVQFSKCIIEYSEEELQIAYPNARIITDSMIKIDVTKRDRRKSCERITIVDLGITSEEDLIIKTGVYTQEQINNIKNSETTIEALRGSFNQIGLSMYDLYLCDSKLMILNIPEIEYLLPKILSDIPLSIHEQYVGVYAVEKNKDRYVVISIAQVFNVFFKSQFFIELQSKSKVDL